MLVKVTSLKLRGPGMPLGAAWEEKMLNKYVRMCNFRGSCYSTGSIGGVGCLVGGSLSSSPDSSQCDVVVRVLL